MSTNSHFTTMVHVLALLAKIDAPVSSTLVAASVNTNPVVIRQIIGHLRDAGLVETLPGSAGGARLKQDAEHITLGDVYTLTKAETFFGLHPHNPNVHCPVGRNIQAVLIDIFDRLDALVTGTLADITIADVIEQVTCQEIEMPAA